MSISKIKEIKIREEDGSYSDPIPMGADAINIDTANGSNLETDLANINKNLDNKTNQINNLQNKDTNLQNQINSLASGNPLVASSVSEMTDTNRVYVNTNDGHWYWYNGSSWTDGGVYQSTELDKNSVKINNIKNFNVTANKILNFENFISLADEIKPNTKLIGYDTESFLPTFESSNNLSVGIFDINKLSNISTSWLSLLPTSDGQLYVAYKSDGSEKPFHASVSDYKNLTSEWYDYKTGLVWFGNIFNSKKYNKIAIQFNYNEEFISFNKINDFDKNITNKIDINFNKKNNDNKFINILQFAYKIEKNKTIDGFNTSTFLPILTPDRNCDVYYFNVDDIPFHYLQFIYYHVATSVLNDINKIILYTENEKARNLTKNYLLTSDSYNSKTGDYKLSNDLLNYKNFAILINDNDNVKSLYSYKIPEILATISMFNSIGAVGDSYTAGDTMDSSGNWVHLPNQSYPQIMANRAGIKCNNFAKGGATTRSYLTSDNYQSLLNTDANDFYFIAFGINDSEKLGTDYIGTIEDIKDDYTQNNDTFYGNYGKIISSILNHNSNAKLCLILIPLEEANTEDFNNAIINIANHFSIPYINPFDDVYFKTDLYNSKSGGHPTAMGYCGMALAYERLFSNCVIKNLDYFKYSTIR